VEVPAGALKCLDPGVDPRELLFDGGDDVALLSGRCEYHMKTLKILAP